MAWSFATMSCPEDDELPDTDSMRHMPPEVIDVFDALREGALRRIGELYFVDLSSLVWAYSTVRRLDEDLWAQTTRAALGLAHDRDQQREAHVAECKVAKSAAEYASLVASVTAVLHSSYRRQTPARWMPGRSFSSTPTVAELSIQ